MKKILFYILLFIGTYLYTIGFGFFCFYKVNKQKEQIKILQSTTDYRHLTSVIYIDLKGDTVASDYLTYKELSNLY